MFPPQNQSNSNTKYLTENASLNLHVRRNFSLFSGAQVEKQTGIALGPVPERVCSVKKLNKNSKSSEHHRRTVGSVASKWSAHNRR